VKSAEQAKKDVVAYFSLFTISCAFPNLFKFAQSI